MGVFEQVFRPGNEGRERECNELVTDIVSDLKYIQKASNTIIKSCNSMLGSDVAPVEYKSKAPKEFVEDVCARYEEIERLARAKYDDIDAVDKPALEDIIKKLEGGDSIDKIENLLADFKMAGYGAELSSIITSIGVFAVVMPALKAVFHWFIAGALGAVIGALAGIAVSAIMDAIAAEQKYHKLEEALRDLKRTKEVLGKSRDQIVNAADDLSFSIRYAQRKAKTG